MKKILIIEDEMPIAELEKDYLELSDFEVTIESDGIEGEKKALTGEYDLLILDVMLPGKDGYEICREFRQKFLAPVIMVSAKKDDIDKIHGLGLGADDYMTKPFSPSELVARVKAHLNRYESLIEQQTEKSDDSDQITVGDLHIDKIARRVFIRGEEKTFTTKEFDLLYFLAKNPNHVFSKDELFQRIWGFTSVGDIATVTVHIKKIREKIELDSSNPEYIETIWGSGYRFKSHDH
ncbi:MAG: response regulator transcription factor [Eubacterium sp.]|nr:response regulator transcription factor [Eubacterium sp.]